ncbi:MAG: cytochrome c biogenesis protein ResB [Candidatus Kerfeldbacteria bacterium]|nr:cytochrome c biogenesis protein ResB [Candidatus Kerfeldbacteria bacterium]
MKVNLGSTRLAFVLIALLTSLIVLSAIIPQQDIAQDQMIDWRNALGDRYVVIEWLGLDRIYYTPAFFVVLGLLGLNLAVGTFRRFRIVLKLEGTLLRLHHVGSIVFHMSLLIIMASVIANYLYKFDGVMALTQGQTGHDSEADYFRMFRGPLYQLGEERFSVQLEELAVKSDTSGNESPVARVALTPTGGGPTVTQEIATNQPLRYESVEVHFGLVNGYSPELIVTDSAGRRLFAGFVRLAVQSTKGQRHHYDFVQLSQIDLTANIRAVPSASEASNPDFLLTVSGQDSSVAERPMTPRDTLSAYGYNFTIPRWRRWCYLNVVENPYLHFVFAGFWSALAGLALGLTGRMAWRRRNAR